jgi:hypothetical protein
MSTKSSVFSTLKVFLIVCPIVLREILYLQSERRFYNRLLLLSQENTMKPFLSMTPIVNKWWRDKSFKNSWSSTVIQWIGTCKVLRLPKKETQTIKKYKLQMKSDKKCNTNLSHFFINQESLMRVKMALSQKKIKTLM